MEDDFTIKDKKPKRWHCKNCNKQYCYLNGAVKHNIKKHEGKARFSDLLEYPTSMEAKTK